MLEKAFDLAYRSAPAIAKVRSAVRDGRLPKKAPESLLSEARAAGILTSAEAEVVEHATRARQEALRVDSFPADEWLAEEPAEQVEPAEQEEPCVVAMAS